MNSVVTYVFLALEFLAGFVDFFYRNLENLIQGFHKNVFYACSTGNLFEQSKVLVDIYALLRGFRCKLGPAYAVWTGQTKMRLLITEDETRFFPVNRTENSHKNY